MGVRSIGTILEGQSPPASVLEKANVLLGKCGLGTGMLHWLTEGYEPGEFRIFLNYLGHTRRSIMIYAGFMDGEEAPN